VCTAEPLSGGQAGLGRQLLQCLQLAVRDQRRWQQGNLQQTMQLELPFA
jgi:hypothetical protein